jgi:hypothetical protein
LESNRRGKAAQLGKNEAKKGVQAVSGSDSLLGRRPAVSPGTGYSFETLFHVIGAFCHALPGCGFESDCGAHGG